MKRFRPTPPTVLAAAALFFALGGSAIAVSDAIKPQPRCATGAVRGIVSVTGDPSKGIANFPTQFTSAKALIPRQFNCGKGAPQVRRSGAGTFEVRFPGNAASTATAASVQGMATVEFTGGLFKVVLYRPGQQDPPYDMPFSLVAV
jgi:hypothetical protein